MKMKAFTVVGGGSIFEKSLLTVVTPNLSYVYSREGKGERRSAKII